MKLKIFLESKKWLVSLFLVNLAGFIFGIYYYYYQLSITSLWSWVFIIDCPLYVLLFAVICALKLKNKSIPDGFYFLTSLGLIKYGLWTGLVIWLYSGHFFSISPILYSLLFPLHIGMILEGVVFFPHFKVKPKCALIVLFWFLLNDVLDYFFGTLPLIPETFTNLLMWESFIATLVLASLIFSLSKRF